MPRQTRYSNTLRYIVLAFSLLSTLSCQNGLMAETAESLPQKIDSLISAAAGDFKPARTCSDEAFVRRVYLDLAGRIPSYNETKQFLASTAPNKRAELIEQLLGSPEFPVRLRDVLHVLLMERRGDNAEWTKFLQVACESNRPWDELVRDILDPNPEDELRRGAAFFHTRRLEKVGQQETDYPGLTRDIGRLFLGMDLQCAQCHDHLFIQSYKQIDFQGLFVVYKNSYIRTDVPFPAIGEKLMTKKGEFSSVFEKVSLTTGPRVPGRPEVEIPIFEKDQEYLVPPNKKVNFAGTPRFRGTQAIASQLPVGDNQAFRDNIANRLWFLMMGRGLIHPLDLAHADNPPSHPELLKLLGEYLVASKFDMKAMLHNLALTETYQRSSEFADGSSLAPPEKYLIGHEKRMSAEQIMNSIVTATGPRERTNEATLAPVKQQDESKKESDQEEPAKPPADKLRAAFVKAFGNVPQDPEVEFSPSLRSSLFVLNDELLQDFLVPRPGNLVDRLMKISDSSEVADELYLSVLTRRPTEEERGDVADYLAKKSECRQTAVSNLTWALVASTEFCLNH